MEKNEGTDIVVLILNGKPTSVSRHEADLIAYNENMDLLEVGNNVFKLVEDASRIKYIKEKAKKKNKKMNTEHTKEIKISSTSASNDILHKTNTALKLLAKGYDILLTVVFKNRKELKPESMVLYETIFRSVMKNILNTESNVKAENYTINGNCVSRFIRKQ
jgi:translation initiation factor IF-3